MSPKIINIFYLLQSHFKKGYFVPTTNTQPALSQFHSLEMRRSANFMLLRNVVRRILKLQNWENVGQALFLSTSGDGMLFDSRVPHFSSAVRSASSSTISILQILLFDCCHHCGFGSCCRGHSIKLFLINFEVFLNLHCRRSPMVVPWFPLLLLLLLFFHLSLAFIILANAGQQF